MSRRSTPSPANHSECERRVRVGFGSRGPLGKLCRATTCVGDPLGVHGRPGGGQHRVIPPPFHPSGGGGGGHLDATRRLVVIIFVSFSLLGGHHGDRPCRWSYSYPRRAQEFDHASDPSHPHHPGGRNTVAATIPHHRSRFGHKHGYSTPFSRVHSRHLSRSIPCGHSSSRRSPCGRRSSRIPFFTSLVSLVSWIPSLTWMRMRTRQTPSRPSRSWAH